MSHFTIDRDVCLMKCPPGLLPQFVLKSYDKDGTRNYVISYGHFPEDNDKIPSEEQIELQRREAAALRWLDKNKLTKIYYGISVFHSYSRWYVITQRGEFNGVTLLEAIEKAQAEGEQ